MSSQELKKKEKGKEFVTLEETPSTSLHHVDYFDQTEEVSMYFNEQGIAALMEANMETHRENLEVEQSKKDDDEKVGMQEKKSSSSKITPCIFYTSDDKARLRWSSDLHDCFVSAVQKLGGSDKATPKAVKEIMEVEGVALHHVKSHLQKFRLGKCNIRDENDPYNKRYKTARGIVKAYAAANPPRPQVNIRPRVTGTVKPKKAKEVQGSLYKLIEHDLHLQRCREAERMQIAFARENNRHMLEAQYLKPSMAPSITSQHSNYISTASTQQPASQKLDQWSTPSSYHFSGGQISDSQQPTTIIPQTTTSVKDFCSDNMACLSICELPQETCNTCFMYEPQHVYTPMIHSAQGNQQFNNNHNSNMIQDFINPYVPIEPQSMSGSSTITAPQVLQLNDSYCNPAFLPTAIPPIVNSLPQGTSDSTFLPFSTAPEAIQTYVPRRTYNYPPYNTLEAVKAQLSALQNSSTNRTQATTSRETNASSSVTRDEEDPVDKYIDWRKVEEIDIDAFDPVEVLEALGFGV